VRQQTRAKIKSLDELQDFFDGSGLLMLEKAVRQQAKTQLDADSQAAVLAQQQITARNEDRQKEIQQFTNETGQGGLGKQNRVYSSDQKRIAEAEAEVEKAKAVEAQAISQTNPSDYSPEAWRKFLAPYDEKIADEQQKLEDIKTQVEHKQVHLSELKANSDEANRQEANATVSVEQKTEEATKNDRRLDELPDDIAEAQFKERMQRAFNAQTEATDAQTDKTLASLPPAVFGVAGAAGGRRVDPDRLNDILAGLILEQDALKKSLAESQKKQARMEQEIEELQRGQKLHAGQIRSANSNRF
jgi:hypothetical protein